MSKHFIATSETPDGKLNDDLTGVIESPAFTIEDDGSILLVSGGSEMGATYVSLVEADGNRELVRLVGRDVETGSFAKLIDHFLGRREIYRQMHHTV